MNTEQLLGLMRLLSALESSMLTSKVQFPPYLIEQLDDYVALIEGEILERGKKCQPNSY